MKITSLFKNAGSANLKAFAHTLANDLAKRYPPELDQSPGKQVSINRLTRIMEDMCEQIIKFQATQKLGWIRKARLANHIQWELKERGYTKKFIEFATEAVVVHLNK